MKRIQCLPELCLLTIFDRIPLDDLTRIGRVCPRWYSLENSAFSRRHRLSLFVYSENPKPESKPGIQLKSFQHSTTQKVIELFPKVTSLTIEHEDDEFNDGSLDPLALTNLLTHHWSSKLVSLGLIMIFPYFKDVNVCSSTVEAINNLPTLKRLSLLESFCYGDFQEPQFRIIAQLEEFFFVSEFDVDAFDFLSKYAEGNTALRRIEIDTFAYNEDKIESMLKLSPELAHKFTSLYSNNHDPLRAKNQLLTRLCLHFSSLHRISIGQCVGGGSFFKRLSALTPLKQLNTLGLDIFSFNTIEDMSAPYEIDPFESVNKLALTFMGSPDETLQFMESFNFVYLFPKLEIVTIDWDLYADDELDDYLLDDDSSIDSNVDQNNRFPPDRRTIEQKRSHYESMIEQLLKCEYLREIKFNVQDFEAKWHRNGKV